MYPLSSTEVEYEEPQENTQLHTAMQQYAKDVSLILYTDDYDEWPLISKSMEPPNLTNVEDTVSTPLRLLVDETTETSVILGEFGGYSAALVTTNYDSELEEILLYLTSAKCILLIGTVVAINRQKHKLSDVVVSDCIDGVFKIDRSQTEATKSVKFAPQDTRFMPVSQSLTSIFRPDSGDSWEGFECTKQRGRKSKVFKGTIISMNYGDFSDCTSDKVLELSSNDSIYQGVDRSGASTVIPVINRLKDKRKLDVILIEGVGCYVRNYRHYSFKRVWGWQTTACMAAIDYAKHKLKSSSESKKYFSGKLL